MSRVALAGAAACLSLALGCGVKAPPRPPLAEAGAAALLDGGPAPAPALDGGAPGAEWPDAGLPRTTP